MELDGKVILVTGAKGGLGTFVTTALLDAGAHVIGVSRSIAPGDFAGAFTALPAEISNSAHAQAVVAEAAAQAKRIDGLIHLVGSFTGGNAVADTDDAVFDQMIDSNLRSAFLMFRAVLRQMRTQGSGGRIVGIGSKAAVEPAPGAGMYAASKAALVSLVRTIARENAEHGITANAILPGTMDTPANRSAMPKADFSKWVQPAQVAQVAVHLMSDRASQISGAVIPVYGQEA